MQSRLSQVIDPLVMDRSGFMTVQLNIGKKQGCNYVQAVRMKIITCHRWELVSKGLLT